MPLSREMAEFVRRFTNRVTCRGSGRAPGLALIEHGGRRSGRRYQTPVNVFGNNGHYVVAPTYEVHG
jgi:hypothetical protein